MNVSPSRPSAFRRNARHVAAWSAALVVLALVTLWYLDPHVMLDLRDRLWACF